jgi:hypothetical protein
MVNERLLDAYGLYYEPIDGGVRLVRVLHGSRKIDELFQ